jgi:tryptophan-rich sensory protein
MKTKNTMKNLTSFALFVLLVMGGGIAIGIITVPGAWYANLQKPFFNPPNWIFGPVWTALYLMIAFVGWRIWQQADNAMLKRLWVTQLCLNFLWSPVFFTAQMPGLALGVIACLLLATLFFVKTAWSQDRLSAILFGPYVAWVGFASILNGAIFYLNSKV